MTFSSTATARRPSESGDPPAAGSSAESTSAPTPPAASETETGAGARAGAGPAVPAVEPPALARLRALAGSARTGDREALAGLLRQLSALVRGAARRETYYAQQLGLHALLEREDLAQEAQRILLELAASYEPERGAPFPFFEVRLRAKLRQRVQAFARRRAPQRPLSWDDPRVVELADRLSQRLFDAQAAGLPAEVRADVHAAVAALSLRQRQLIRYVYWEDLTLVDAAARLGISETAARAFHRRALKQLRTRLTDGDGHGAGPAGSGTT